MQKPDDYWKGMPVYSSSPEPYKKLTVSFETEKDFLVFSELINQPLNEKTKNIWFPSRSDKKVWVDESS